MGVFSVCEHLIKRTLLLLYPTHHTVQVHASVLCLCIGSVHTAYPHLCTVHTRHDSVRVSQPGASSAHVDYKARALSCRNLH